MRRLSWLLLFVFVGTGFLWAQRFRAIPKPTPTVSTEMAAPVEELVRRSPEINSRGELSVRRVIGGEEAFGFIKDVAFVDSSFIALDAQNYSHILIVNRSTGAVVGSAGETGRGPGEFVSPRAFVPDRRDPSHVWTYDFELARLEKFHARPFHPDPMATISTDAALFEPAWIGDTLVSNGFFPSELIRFYVVRDGIARIVKRAGQLPFPDAPPYVVRHLNRNSMAWSPSGEKFALGFLYTSRVQIYERSGVLRQVIAGPVDVSPEYQVITDHTANRSRFHRGPKTRWAYIGVAASDQRIYALFSGRSREEFRDQAYGAREIHVFDWHGDLLSIWSLPEDVYAIVLDPATEDLYGFRMLPFPAILHFGLIPSDVV